MWIGLHCKLLERLCSIIAEKREKVKSFVQKSGYIAKKVAKNMFSKQKTAVYARAEKYK